MPIKIITTIAEDGSGISILSLGAASTPVSHREKHFHDLIQEAISKASDTDMDTLKPSSNVTKITRDIPPDLMKQ